MGRIVVLLVAGSASIVLYDGHDNAESEDLIATEVKERRAQPVASPFEIIKAHVSTEYRFKPSPSVPTVTIGDGSGAMREGSDA